MSNIGKSKGGQRSYNFSGYALFVEEQKKTNPRKKMSLQAAGASLRESWNKLEEHERLEYKSRAKELRGPAKGKKYIVPFYTRCAPKQFIDVCKVLKGRPKTMERLKVIGFDKLVRISCSQIQRDLCGVFMRAFDPPTKTISIRGKTYEMDAINVNEIMGLPLDGYEIIPTTCDEERFKEMKIVYGKVPYTTIACWLVDEKEHADLEFLFVMYSVGILLDPSACIYVNDKVLKVMALTKDAYREFDWCTFVLNKLADSVKDYLEELRKGDAGGRKNIGGCLYFLMIYCLQMFPLGRQKASEVGDAISYWNDEQVQARTRLEKESKQGVLHGSTSKERPEASMFNPDVDLTHPLIKASYSRIMNMVGEELLALQHRLLGEAEGGDVNEAADHYEEGADEGIQHDEKDGGEGEGEEEGNRSGNQGADGGRDERGEEGGDEGNEQEEKTHVRRSNREKRPAVRSPYFVETKARVAKKRKNIDDKEALFNMCTSQCAGCEEQETYVEMNGFHVTRGELGCLRSRAWMSTTVMTMVAKTLVQDEKDRTRSVRRHIFSAHFMQKMLVNPLRWSIEGNESEILPQHLGYNIGDCDFIFGPACVMDHWFCYVFDVNKMQFCALDSLVDTLTFIRLQRQQLQQSSEEDRKGKRKKRTSGQPIWKEKQWMANACKCCFLKILRTLKPQVFGQDDQFAVNWPKLHLQTDTYSCGIIVLSWLKTWDGNTVDDKGFTMPKYSIEDLHQLRVDCLCWLINHPNNSQRERVLSILSEKESRHTRK